MKIQFEPGHYLELKQDYDKVAVSIKTKDSDNKGILITAKISTSDIDKIISELVKLRIKVADQE